MELKSGVVKNGLLRVQLFILMNANFNVYVKFWFSYIFSAAIVIFHIIIYIFVRPIQFFSVSYLLNMNGCVENSTDVSALNFILYKRTDLYSIKQKISSKSNKKNTNVWPYRPQKKIKSCFPAPIQMEYIYLNFILQCEKN